MKSSPPWSSKGSQKRLQIITAHLHDRPRACKECLDAHLHDLPSTHKNIAYKFNYHECLEESGGEWKFYYSSPLSSKYLYTNQELPTDQELSHSVKLQTNLLINLHSPIFVESAQPKCTHQAIYTTNKNTTVIIQRMLTANLHSMNQNMPLNVFVK